jgi:hypothetical protein
MTTKTTMRPLWAARALCWGVLEGCKSRGHSYTIPPMADESNRPEPRFEHRLVTGPNAERPSSHPEGELDAKTRAKLHETFRRLDREQTEAYSASHEYYLT